MLEIVLVLIVHDSVQATSYVLDSLAIFYGLEMVLVLIVHDSVQAKDLFTYPFTLR